MSPKVAMIEIGIAMPITSVAEPLRRNASRTMTERMPPQIAELRTLSIELWMKLL
jgi:hypothetical protein